MPRPAANSSRNVRRPVPRPRAPPPSPPAAEAADGNDMAQMPTFISTAHPPLHFGQPQEQNPLQFASWADYWAFGDANPQLELFPPARFSHPSSHATFAAPVVQPQPIDCRQCSSLQQSLQLHQPTLLPQVDGAAPLDFSTLISLFPGFDWTPFLSRLQTPQGLSSPKSGKVDIPASDTSLLMNNPAAIEITRPSVISATPRTGQKRPHMLVPAGEQESMSGASAPAYLKKSFTPTNTYKEPNSDGRGDRGAALGLEELHFAITEEGAMFQELMETILEEEL